MFQFSELASFRITSLQLARLSHSEIQGFNACVQLPLAYRSLPRPSSPLRPKASTMRPYFALKILNFYSYSRYYICFTQYVKELQQPIDGYSFARNINLR
jgi:hypothetical protein